MSKTIVICVEGDGTLVDNRVIQAEPAVGHECVERSATKIRIYSGAENE